MLNITQEDFEIEEISYNELLKKWSQILKAQIEDGIIDPNRPLLKLILDLGGIKTENLVLI